MVVGVDQKLVAEKKMQVSPLGCVSVEMTNLLGVS